MKNSFPLCLLLMDTLVMVKQRPEDDLQFLVKLMKWDHIPLLWFVCQLKKFYPQFDRLNFQNITS